MGFDEFIFISSRLFFQPFKTLSVIYEILKDEQKRNVIRLGIMMSLMGNTAGIIAGMISHHYSLGVNGIFFFIYQLVFQIFMCFVLSFFWIALSFFVLYLLKKEKELLELDKTFALFLIPDFLWIGLVPVAMINRAFIHSGTFYALISFILLVILTLLKIKGVAKTALLSGIKSAGLLITPALMILLVILGSVVYGVLFLSSFF